MSFSNSLGRGVGKLGAYTAHAAISVAVGSGRFGADLIDGVESGYVDKSAELKLARDAARAKRTTALAIKAQPATLAPGSLALPTAEAVVAA